MWSSLWCVWSIATRWVCMLEESGNQQWIQRSGTSCTLSLKKTSGLQEKAVHSCLRPMFHPRSNLQNLQWPRPLLLQPSCGTHSGSPQKPRCVQEWGAPLIFEDSHGDRASTPLLAAMLLFFSAFPPSRTSWKPGYCRKSIDNMVSVAWPKCATARVSGKLRHVQSL